jgi:uncharacterized membrane protein
MKTPKTAPRMPGSALFIGLKARPRLLVSMTVGLIIGLICARLFHAKSWTTPTIIGWDATCLTFIVSALVMMRGSTPGEIRAAAAKQDEGALTILALVVVAAAVSLWAVAAELSLAKDAPSAERAARVTLAFVTVAASWFTVQLIFALHYAHGYYGTISKAGKQAIAGGLEFPGGQEPDYWDFLHFAVVIGAAAQTADIMFTSKSIRRVGTAHTLLAFTFNTVILALTINLLAGLIT